ncbi:sugar abc transporter permease protein [Mycoplasmopsis canis UF31]|uniref:ABC transporter permease n=1 Tax=Mycoplasmopsis canis TaxID=29555 RepID=UPI00025ACFBF|nr:ABC transporter permease [Mycoplasmopsis canis]EIE39637.1 sugar abc transporter permease protein [Mycoplasmopsis canis UF31]
MELILGYTFFFFTLLLLGTISGIFSERAGIVNIAINGFMVFGAAIYSVFSVIFTDFLNITSMWSQIPLTILAGLVTLLFGMLFGLATVKFKSDQTISGFAINILAAGIAAMVILFLTTRVQKAGSVIVLGGREELALSSSIGTYKNIVSLKLVIVVIVALGSWFALRKTRWGLRFRSVGENPQAADVAGINVNKIKWQALAIAGFIAGIAGSIFAQSQINFFSLTKDVQGFGFIALAIMITSRWKITYSVIISLFFSFLLAFSFYGVNVLGESLSRYRDLLAMIPYVITLIIMIASSKNSYGPAAAGIPYDKTKR